MKAHVSIAIGWLLLCVAFGSCTSPGGKPAVSREMREFEAFFREKVDSVSIDPRGVRRQALQKMREAEDSLVRYNYLSLALKTCLITLDVDSARRMISQIEEFVKAHPLSPQLADLHSECLNMKGNFYARSGRMDSAEIFFEEAYEYRKLGARVEVMPEILMNLADADNRLGKLDVGAAHYRHALLLCDSLRLPSGKKFPIYYGLAQIYVALRDFEQCDHYYNLAARSYADMLPLEKHIYLNNRGVSYYYREDYVTAISYFRQVDELLRAYPDMLFEQNLTWLNLGDCFLQLNEADSAAKYIHKCLPFFDGLKSPAVDYYVDTQKIKLALLQGDHSEARRLFDKSVTPPCIDLDMVHIRNKYVQQFCEEIGDYREAYRYLQKNNRLDDSIRNERIRMRTADLALRYQQDSTLMANRVQLQEHKNKVLLLRQTQIGVLAIAVVAILTTLFLHLYNRKKRDLLLARNRRTVSVLRLENIRNRLSPHFIFNVLNREMAGRHMEEKQELAPLVRLMRRNLELVERLCITLDEELDFVNTYIDLERRSLGEDFHAELTMEEDVCPQQVQILSMMIQIPVENAVKHALRDKEGRRNLWIAVARRGNGIRIRITDNGGGFRPNSRNRGTGTGMKAVMQTIQILNSKNKTPIDVSVHNVSLPGGEVGCEVAFLLPDDYDYSV